MGAILGAILGGAVQAGLGAINNTWAEQQQEQARKQNYMYGEMSAENADKRTRALYNDFYSPEALMNQYKAAGLSPSMMFGGTPGQGGMSGAQGNGATGLGTPFMPMSMLEGAQIANIAAQTDKTKAETKNIEANTEQTYIQNEWQEMQKEMYKNEFNLITAPMYKEDGSETSMYEMANDCWDYDTFIKRVREAAEKGGRGDLQMFTGTEQGQKLLRSIYMNANRFSHDISVLSSEKTSAEFQKQVITAMKKEGFADMNAKTAVQYLKANIQAGELQETQKEAWNNLLNRMEKGTTRDIVIVLGMMLNNAMTNWRMPNFGDHVSNTYNTVKTAE